MFADWLRSVDWKQFLRGLAVIALAAGFVLIGAGDLDLGPIESRLGLALGEPFGPFGQVYGGWDPSLWPVPVALGRIWTLSGDGIPTDAAVRWPAAIAAVMAGFLLTRRMNEAFGARASVLMGLCWFGSIGIMDRSAGAGLDMFVGLGTIAALDRILGRGSDLVAGLWAALAFLSGGWPPLAVIALATVVIGRRTAGLSWKLILPPLLAATAWSGWALSQAQAEAWAAALALPLTQPSAWLLVPGVLGLGLPWTPLVLFAASGKVRAGWPERGRALVLGWLQVAGACLLAGTLVPGLAVAARLPALAGLAVVAAAAGTRIWSGAFADSPHPRRLFLGVSATIAAGWVALVTVAGVFLASAVPYYRGLAIVLIGCSLLIGLVSVASLFLSDPRRSLIVLTTIALSLKLAHWGYYVPEWNYRRSQGPWGRAIGQWVVPLWPIYSIHSWPHDLAFATEHPFRQLPHPRSLAFQDGPSPKFVLLLAPEFEHWPADAPELVRVATFEDEKGSSRVLARTAGPFSWSALVRARSEEKLNR